MALNYFFNNTKLISERYANLYYTLNTKLLPKGYIVLVDDIHQVIAFNPNNNALFFVADKSSYDSRFSYFQKPAYNERTKRVEVNTYKCVEEMNDEKIPFPIFSSDNYLNLTSLCLDGFEGKGFENSLRKIAKYPILMDAIGEENRQMCKEYSNEKVFKLN